MARAVQSSWPRHNRCIRRLLVQTGFPPIDLHGSLNFVLNVDVVERRCSRSPRYCDTASGGGTVSARVEIHTAKGWIVRYGALVVVGILGKQIVEGRAGKVLKVLLGNLFVRLVSAGIGRNLVVIRLGGWLLTCCCAGAAIRIRVIKCAGLRQPEDQVVSDVVNDWTPVVGQIILHPARWNGTGQRLGWRRLLRTG